MNTLFKTNNKIKIRGCDKSIHKDMRIPVDTHQMNNKFSDTIQPKNTCKLEFSHNLWVQFIDQPQYEIVVFQ